MYVKTVTISDYHCTENSLLQGSKLPNIRCSLIETQVAFIHDSLCFSRVKKPDEFNRPRIPYADRKIKGRKSVRKVNKATKIRLLTRSFRTNKCLFDITGPMSNSDSAGKPIKYHCKRLSLNPKIFS